MNEVSLTRFKACTNCGCVKPLTPDFFHRQKQTKSGFSSRCKVCRQLDTHRWLANNKTYHRDRLRRLVREERTRRELAGEVIETNRWSEDEDAVLRERYPHEPTGNLILAFPGRTLSSIKSRAESLGLKKTPEYREALLKVKRRQLVQARKGKPAHNRQPRITVHCQECGISLEVSPRRAKELQFCSLKCKGLAQRRIPAEDDPRYSRVERVCEWCGGSFLTHPCKIRVGEGRFCSRSCSGSFNTYTMPRISKREREFCELLTGAGLEFDTQAKIGRWTVDVYFPMQKLIVEFDGDYWHSLPNVKARDERKTVQWKRQGYMVLRIAESLFVKTPQAALRSVESALGGGG